MDPTRLAQMSIYVHIGWAQGGHGEGLPRAACAWRGIAPPAPHPLVNGGTDLKSRGGRPEAISELGVRTQTRTTLRATGANLRKDAGSEHPGAFSSRCRPHATSGMTFAHSTMRYHSCCVSAGVVRTRAIVSPAFAMTAWSAHIDLLHHTASCVRRSGFKSSASARGWTYSTKSLFATMVEWLLRCVHARIVQVVSSYKAMSSYEHRVGVASNFVKIQVLRANIATNVRPSELRDALWRT